MTLTKKPAAARLALNYKGIPYTTEWTEYPDIAPKFTALYVSNHPPPPQKKKNQLNSPKPSGLAPHEAGPAAYTIPTVQMPSGAIITDSLAIAHALEAHTRSPSLHLDAAVLEPVQRAVSDAFAALRPLVLPMVPATLLNEPSASFFLRTRAERFGQPLARLAESEAVRSGRVWREAEEGGLAALRELLREDASGPFFLGREVSYADFVFVAFLRFFERVDRRVLFERCVRFDEGFGRLYEACGKWLERDD